MLAERDVLELLLALGLLGPAAELIVGVPPIQVGDDQSRGRSAVDWPIVWALLALDPLFRWVRFGGGQLPGLDVLGRLSLDLCRSALGTDVAGTTEDAVVSVLDVRDLLVGRLRLRADVIAVGLVVGALTDALTDAVINAVSRKLVGAELDCLVSLVLLAVAIDVDVKVILIRSHAVNGGWRGSGERAADADVPFDLLYRYDSASACSDCKNNSGGDMRENQPEKRNSRPRSHWSSLRRIGAGG